MGTSSSSYVAKTSPDHSKPVQGKAAPMSASDYHPSPSPNPPDRLERLSAFLTPSQQTPSAAKPSNVSMASDKAFLAYAPTKDSARSYPTFLDALGFKAEAASMRLQLIAELKAHVDARIDFKLVRASENPVEFRKMVLDFLDSHGIRFWGPTQRDHLAEKDPKKGFLMPRDAERHESR